MCGSEESVSEMASMSKNTAPAMWRCWYSARALLSMCQDASTTTTLDRLVASHCVETRLGTRSIIWSNPAYRVAVYSVRFNLAAGVASISSVAHIHFSIALPDIASNEQLKTLVTNPTKLHALNSSWLCLAGYSPLSRLASCVKIALEYDILLNKLCIFAATNQLVVRVVN